MYSDCVNKLGIILPVGSIILVGSASHLAEVGSAAYAEDLVAMCGKLRALHSGGIYIIPSPFLLLGGSSDPALILACAEIGGWLHSILSENPQNNSLSLNATEIATSHILDDFGYSKVTHAPKSIMLPISLGSSTKKSWCSGEMRLPKGVLLLDLAAGLGGPIQCDFPGPGQHSLSGQT